MQSIYISISLSLQQTGANAQQRTKRPAMTQTPKHTNTKNEMRQINATNKKMLRLQKMEPKIYNPQNKC